MARQMFERLQLDEHARGVVEFLVREHLKMSVAAFRRDTEDPEVVRQFAELVGVEERLKMLCLMTLADVEAVSLETLTAWREDLLWRLYVDTYNHLTLSYGDEVIDPGQAATSTLITDLITERPPDLTATGDRNVSAGTPASVSSAVLAGRGVQSCSTLARPRSGRD